MLSKQHLGVALADEPGQALESALFEDLINITFDVPLAAEAALLGKLNGRLNVLGHSLQNEECLRVLLLVGVVETDEEADLCGAQALGKLVLQGLEGVQGVFVQVQDRLLGL